MKLWRWLPGRQGTGYRKLLLARGRSWDCYLLDCPPGVGVPDHTDPVPGKKHQRLNVTLLGDPRQFVAVGWGVSPTREHVRHSAGWRVVLFRPDLVTHAVDAAPKRRVVLSFGWAQ